MDRTFDNWSASAAAFLRPAPGLFLGLSLAHNERAPSEVELFADGVHIATAAYETGDVNLNSEKVNTLEATAHYDRGRFTGDLHVYHSWYDGFIDERATGETFLFEEENEESRSISSSRPTPASMVSKPKAPTRPGRTATASCRWKPPPTLSTPRRTWVRRRVFRPIP